MSLSGNHLHWYWQTNNQRHKTNQI